MNMIWWLLPAVSGLIGLLLCLGGLGRLFKFKPMTGTLRLLCGTSFLGLAGVVAFTGLNLQTYKRLTFERPVATITFTQAETPEKFNVTMLYPGGKSDNFELYGDEWEVNARVVKFKAFSNLLGFDSLYKLDRLYGRYEDVGRASETNGHPLTENPGLDVVALDKQIGSRFGVVDARYGSAVYNPMEHGLSFEVMMTQTGLIARPANDVTRERMSGQTVGEILEEAETE